MKNRPIIEIKRVYSHAQEEDGFRVIIDRVWPRGVSKKKLQADLWLEDAAPSPDLRKWFGHDRSKWEEFQRYYFAELDENPEVIRNLLDLSEKHEEFQQLLKEAFHALLAAWAPGFWLLHEAS